MAKTQLGFHLVVCFTVTSWHKVLSHNAGISRSALKSLLSLTPLCTSKLQRHWGVGLDNRGFPKTWLESAKCCASASQSSCQHTSGSPLSFSLPLFHHLLFSCFPCCVPLHSPSVFLFPWVLPSMYKWGTNSGCRVAALPQMGTLINTEWGWTGPPAASYAPANLSWAVAPTHLRDLCDASTAERQKPYGEKGFACPLLYPKESVYWELKILNTL